MGLFSLFIFITALTTPIYCNDVNLNLDPTAILQSLTTMLSFLQAMQRNNQPSPRADDNLSSNSAQNDSRDSDEVVNRYDESNSIEQQNDGSYESRYEPITITLQINPPPNSGLLLNLLRKFNFMRPRVEMSPGTFKTEIVTYPPDYLKKRLKSLLKIQEKRDRKAVRHFVLTPNNK